jgi:hypothetical protein
VWDAPTGGIAVRDAMRVLMSRVDADSSTLTMLQEWLSGNFPAARAAAAAGFAATLQTRVAVELACLE